MKQLAYLLSIAIFTLASGCGPDINMPSRTIASEGGAHEMINEPDDSFGGVPVAETPVGETPVPVTPLPLPFDDGPEKYNRPWRNPDTVIVIDAYQGNPIDWDRMATDRRVVGVIHRATIGRRVDTQYAARREIAKRRGYLWGAYHLGDSSDPITQANLFLDVVGDDPDTLLILDLEDTSNPSMMNVSNAVKFMEYVYRVTGKVPVVYANHTTTKALNSALAGHALFRASKLWYARFRSDIPDFPKGIWDTYFLWQFSSEINCSKTGSCLYNVPGTQYDMDINVFYGTRAALEAQWNNNPVFR